MDHELFTIAFPELSETGAEWIERNRQQEKRNIAPHFTIAFGVGIIPKHEYLSHVSNVAKATPAIEFHCRRVTVGTDHRDNTGYSFLVPDKGNSEMYRLHDRLYSGPLLNSLNLEVPFLPHLTLGHFETLAIAKEFCDALNTQGISVSGRIGGLSVVVQTGRGITQMAEFELTG